MAYRMTAYRTDAGSEGWVPYSVSQPGDPVPFAGTYIRRTIVEAPSGIQELAAWADRPAETEGSRFLFDGHPYTYTSGRWVWDGEASRIDLPRRTLVEEFDE